MCNQVSGDVRDGGTVLQVNQVTGDILLSGTSPPRNWATPARRLSARVLLVLLLIGGQQYAVSVLGDTTFPDGVTVRPFGVDERVITRLVEEKLRQCAASAVTAPANCPQRGGAQGVHLAKWAVIGDPRDGMRVVWHRDRFQVSGTAVMTLDYLTRNGGFGYEFDEVRFTAEVRWRGRDTTLADVSRISNREYGEPTRKRGFELTREAVADAIRARFDACTAATTSPMPVICPRAKDTPELCDVEWVLNGNLMISADVEQDAEFGVVRVTGSYSVTAWPRDWQGKIHPLLPFTQSGTYAATLARTGDGSARLLEIRHVP